MPVKKNTMPSSEISNVEEKMTTMPDEVVLSVEGEVAGKAGMLSSKKVILGLLAIIIIAIGGYFTYAHFKQTPEQKATAETASLIKKVQKLMILPDGQTPAVFVIQDPALLSSQQAFFAGSVKGDELLVYSQSGKAIIYSPSRNVIVNVGPVTFDKEKAGANGTPGAAPAATAPASTNTTPAKDTTKAADTTTKTPAEKPATIPIKK
jgi:hypothetical protein